jgi:predicted nucleic acid-binding protein
VINASAAVEYLLQTTLGLKIADIIEGAFLVAPALLDVEALSILRRAVLHRKLAEQHARLALEELMAWQIDRIGHTNLLQDTWRHRQNVSGDDAFYVAAAHIYDIPLLTVDGSLSRAPALGIVVRNIRLE